MVALQDKCPSCDKIVHPMCGYITAEGDKYECDSCHEKNTSSVKDIVPSTVSTEEMSSKNESKKLSVTSSPTIITAIDINKQVKDVHIREE